MKKPAPKTDSLFDKGVKLLTALSPILCALIVARLSKR